MTSARPLDLGGDAADLRAVEAEIAQGAVVERVQRFGGRLAQAPVAPGVAQLGDQAGEGASGRKGREAKGVKRYNGESEAATKHEGKLFERGGQPYAWSSARSQLLSGWSGFRELSELLARPAVVRSRSI